MKHILHITLIIFTLIFLISCENKQEKQLKIIMLSDISGIDDKSFKANIWQGVLMYAKEHNLPKNNYAFSLSSTQEDMIENISNFADMNTDLIITSGILFQKPLSKVAPKYPKQKFLAFDVWDNTLKNVATSNFLVNEASYLAGICAALKAKELNSDKIGFLGGMDIDPIRDFLSGYEAGAKKINKNIQIISKFVGDFANPTKGEEFAKDMFSDGIKIIFNVAGSTGNGLIKEAKRRALKNEQAWVIGVDKDQYEDGLYGPNKSVILTSVLKRLDVATYQTILDVQNGNFTNGAKVYSLKNHGVGIPEQNPNLKPKWLEIVNKSKSDIIAGKIKLNKSSK